MVHVLRVCTGRSAVRRMGLHAAPAPHPSLPVQCWGPGHAAHLLPLRAKLGHAIANHCCQAWACHHQSLLTPQVRSRGTLASLLIPTLTYPTLTPTLAHPTPTPTLTYPTLTPTLALTLTSTQALARTPHAPSANSCHCHTRASAPSATSCHRRTPAQAPYSTSYHRAAPAHIPQANRPGPPANRPSALVSARSSTATLACRTMTSTHS